MWESMTNLYLRRHIRIYRLGALSSTCAVSRATPTLCNVNSSASPRGGEGTTQRRATAPQSSLETILRFVQILWEMGWGKFAGGGSSERCTKQLLESTYKQCALFACSSIWSSQKKICVIVVRIGSVFSLEVVTKATSVNTELLQQQNCSPIHT